MGSEELAANLFRITQTESKLKKENKKMIDQIYKIKDWKYIAKILRKNI